MRWKTFIFGLIVAGGGAAAFLHYGGLQALQKAEAPVAVPPQMPPQKVAVVTVEPQQIPVVSDLPGRIAPTRIAEVRPRVSGILIERVFTQGARVEKGDVLYRIDPEPFQVRVDRAVATLAQANAAEIAADQSASRQIALKDRNVVSEQQYDDAVANLARTRALVAIAEAELASARIDLRHTEVRAPISGIIGRARITEGALVASTDPESLATIQQLDMVYADFNQPSKSLMALRRSAEAGRLAQTDDGKAAVHLFLDDGTAYDHSGKLLFSETTVDASTGQVMLRGEFPNPEGDLLPGMYVRVEIEEGVEAGVLAVPQQAVQRDAGGRALLNVVNAESQVEVRVVKAGRVVDGLQVITEGIQAGDQVIVEGFQKIRPGATVAPEPWALPSAPAEAG